MITVSEPPEIDAGVEAGSSADARWSAATDAFLDWRAGTPDALEDLVRILSPVLWQVVRATGLDREAAEDVVQTTWLALVRNAGSISEPRAVAGWLCTTARREAWRVSKRDRRETATDDDALSPALPNTPGPEHAAVLSEEKQRLLACVERLNERCRRLIRIVAAGVRPDYQELSRSLGMPVGSIGPTRARCLDKLRHELVQAGGL